MKRNITAFLNQLPEYQEYIHSLFQKLGITKLIYVPESADEVMDKTVLLTDERLDRTLSYIRRCDHILNRYLVFTILDSAIVGILNAVIMIVLRMPYVGLISIIAGVSGLLILLAIVTFGNMFGVGGLLLAIPFAAVCDFSYREVTLPYLKKRKEAKASVAGKTEQNEI